MSVLNEKWELSQQAQEFFVYATLGIVPKRLFNDGEKYREWIKNNTSVENLSDKCQNALSKKFNYTFYCAFMCAKAAYNDLCRTLTYASNYKSSSKDKNAIKEKEKRINRVCIELSNSICNGNSINSNPEELFKVLYNNDEFEKGIFDLSEFLENKKDNQKFHFGQVQKWVNMTLKYLYLLGIIENPAGLHIPIDSYIIEALWKETKISLPANNDKEYDTKRLQEYRESHNYSEEKVKSWSLWNKKEYDSLRSSLDEKNLNLDINWEHEAWIAVAEKRKGVFSSEELKQRLQK